jgi:hypothetical protein
MLKPKQVAFYLKKKEFVLSMNKVAFNWLTVVFIVAPCILKIHQILKATTALIYIVLF